MKTFLKICICSFIVATFISCSEEGFNENGIGSIKGTVVEEGTNVPLENVKITTVPASNTVFTDINGDFTIEIVGAGDYSVTADVNEYVSEVQAANVKDAVVTNVVFELSKSTANNRPPDAPTLVFPPDNATEVGFTVEFIWTTTDPDEDDLTYTLELRNGNTNGMEIYEVGRDTSFVVNNLQIATNYFWQVNASDALNDPVSSTISEFTTITELNNPYLFVKKVNGNNVIYSGGEVVDDVDFNLFRITDPNFNSYKPRRNLTVEKIAFLRTVGGETHLFTMNFDGTGVKRITTDRPVSGFRNDQINFTWAKNGQKLYYPYFDKLIEIDADDGGGGSEIFQTTDGSLITEVDIPEFDQDLIVLKTNNINGYEARIFTARYDQPTDSWNEETVVLENILGAVGSVSFDATAQRVLYTRDKSFNQNNSYRIFENRIFVYTLATMVEEEILTDVVIGENDLEVRFWPSEGGIIFTRKTNNFGGVPHVLRGDLDGSTDDKELFTEAFMPDWE